MIKTNVIELEINASKLENLAANLNASEPHTLPANVNASEPETVATNVNTSEHETLLVNVNASELETVASILQELLSMNYDFDLFKDNMTTSLNEQLSNNETASLNEQPSNNVTTSLNEQPSFNVTTSFNEQPVLIHNSRSCKGQQMNESGIGTSNTRKRSFTVATGGNGPTKKKKTTTSSSAYGTGTSQKTNVATRSGPIKNKKAAGNGGP
ncbi:hypothetical protein Tco_0262373 [Tanacetum coccineum]